MFEHDQCVYEQLMLGSSGSAKYLHDCHHISSVIWSSSCQEIQMNDHLHVLQTHYYIKMFIY